jgi:uncharacterized protein YnzC (UPF0291/DUF896 family)
MEPKKLERINQLYKKSKESGLNSEEKIEQDLLRKEYVQLVRSNLRGTLDNTVIQNEDGTVTRLKKSDHH